MWITLFILYLKLRPTGGAGVWPWVLAPIWGSAAFALLVILCAAARPGRKPEA